MIWFSTLVLPTFGLRHPHVPLAHHMSLLPQNPRHSSRQALHWRLIMAQDQSKGLSPKTLSPSVASLSLSKNSVRLSRLDLNSDLFSVAVAVSSITSGLITGELSGIMGLGFNTISALNATPFWQALYNANQLSEPLFSFYLARYIDQSTMSAAPGGVLTLGGTNSSLYQGSIEYLDLTGPASYWLLNVNC